MPERPSEPAPDVETMTYEQAIEALETIIDQIEEGTIGLEDSIKAYRRGTALIRRCKNILERAEQEVQTLEEGDDEGEGAGP